MREVIGRVMQRDDCGETQDRESRERPGARHETEAETEQRHIERTQTVRDERHTETERRASERDTESTVHRARRHRERETYTDIDVTNSFFFAPP